MRVSNSSSFIQDTEQLEEEVNVLSRLLRAKRFELDAALTQARVNPESIIK